MKRKHLAIAALLSFAGGTSGVEAQHHFHGVCSPGALRVCASADVFVTANNELLINVWNLSQTGVTNSGLPTDMTSYSSRTGGWHTITAIGLSNVGYTLPYRPYAGLVDASFFDGTNTTLLPKWIGNADATSLQIYNTGGDITGHREGITGCFDPGPVGSGHAQTCSSYPYAPYVTFTLKGYGSLDLTNARFEFQSQQVAYEHCDVANWDDNTCLGNVVTSRSGPSTEVVPEPFTLVLVGSGLLGVGAARRRRRRALEIESE